ncbi:DUF4232 domain-containing protein [Aquabacterium sp. A7-Y]|uniref:DUF4232 domain-containing protein n=1 Tax=Aquabacterium sp. A7-Y TaxID=1349605 RepID=UPI00223E1567|nr:DUF4232 domain-containing protein [Aquabacterium sp. A7-Y]MCW7539486.1 DUF4232 domain-containing protein [Aquabacterium sp. A7-Y]
MKHRFPFSADALAAAVLLCTAASGAALAQTGAARVPWLDQPASDPVTTAAASPVADRPCSAGEIKVSAGQQGAWRGFATQELRIRKVGPGTCTLSGAPALALVASDGKRQAARQAESAAAQDSRRIEVSEDHDAVLLVGAPGACDAAAGPSRRVSRQIELTPLGGGALMVDGVHLDTVCGAATVLYVEQVVDEPRRAARVAAAAAPAQATLDALTARLEAPSAVARGGTLRYVVTLTNESGSALPLSPCPSYQQSLYVEGRSVDSRYRLNCSGAGGQIAPHSSVSFEMEGAVPGDLAGEHVKLSWVLRDGPAAGTIAELR